MIPGDAVATVRQESALSVASQGGTEGPPPYFTPNREQALVSIRRIAALEYGRMAPSHGQPGAGEALREGLRRLAIEYAVEKEERAPAPSARARP